MLKTLNAGSGSRLGARRLSSGGVLLPFLALAACALLAGCTSIRHGPTFDPRKDTSSLNQSGGTNVIDPAWLKPSTNEFRLGPGDLLDVEIIGHNDAPAPALVGPDGKIYFDLLPGLNVWGLTLRQTRDLLEKGMGAYINHPRVAVTLHEARSQRVWILGRVSTPGIYSLTAPTTLIEAISTAGGLATSSLTGTTEEVADLPHSFIMRRGKLLPINFQKLVANGDTSQNIYLEPDDLVFLPAAAQSEVYVIGAVMLPRPVVFKNQVTLSSAIATAGGLSPDAHPREVVIVRGSLTEPHFAKVNLTRILKGKDPEIRLQPRDIVFVPDTPLDVLQKAGYVALQTFVRTVAANEGLRAGGTVQNVGVNINVNP